MIVVNGYGPYFGMPDGSPFVMKTMFQLRLAGLDFEHRASGVAGAPRGKVPYIEDDGVTISDSTLIRFHIEEKYGIELDASLDAEQRAVAWTIEKMAEEHLYFALIDNRWRDDENFAAGPAHFFDRLPTLLRPLVRRIGRRHMARTLHLQGLGRLSREDVDRIACRDIDALATLLGGKPFMMGEKASSVDGFLFGILSNLLVPIFRTLVGERIRTHPNLLAYVERISRDYFHPAETQTLGERQAAAG